VHSRSTSIMGELGGRRPVGSRPHKCAWKRSCGLPGKEATPRLDPDLSCLPEAYGMREDEEGMAAVVGLNPPGRKRILWTLPLEARLISTVTQLRTGHGYFTASTVVGPGVGSGSSVGGDGACCDTGIVDEGMHDTRGAWYIGWEVTLARFISDGKTLHYPMCPHTISVCPYSTAHFYIKSYKHQNEWKLATSKADKTSPKIMHQNQPR